MISNYPARNRKHEWREVTISTLLKAEQLGWTWLVDPRKRNGPALKSKGGVIYDFKATRTGAYVRQRRDLVLGQD